MQEKLDAIEQIRKFNRFYTPLIGILDRNYGSLSNFGVLKCLCTPGEDMH